MSRVSERIHQASNLLISGIGLEAAAAAADTVCQDDYADRRRRGVGYSDMDESTLEDLQIRASKATLLAKSAIRAKLLAEKETRELRRLSLQAIDLQLHKIQIKSSELLSHQQLVSRLRLGIA